VPVERIFVEEIPVYIERIVVKDIEVDWLEFRSRKMHYLYKCRGALLHSSIWPVTICTGACWKDSGEDSWEACGNKHRLCAYHMHTRMNPTTQATHHKCRINMCKLHTHTHTHMCVTCIHTHTRTRMCMHPIRTLMCKLKYNRGVSCRKG
jgi:hypothetical protein